MKKFYLFVTMILVFTLFSNVVQATTQVTVNPDNIDLLILAGSDSMVTILICNEAAQPHWLTGISPLNLRSTG